MKTLQVTLLSLLALAVSITAGCGSSGNPTFSKLAFSSSRTADPSTPLFLMNLDGSSVTPVPYNLDGIYSPSVSADFKKVAFVSFPNVWVMNSNGTGSTQLTTYTDSSDDQNSYIFYSRISPNGKKILYSLWDGVAGLYGVWIMNADGSGKQNLTATLPTAMIGCYSGSFSADSRKVTFACFSESGDGVYLANADGSHQQTVVPATEAFLDTPMFSPDGKKILFVGYGYSLSGAVRSKTSFSSKPTVASIRTGVHSHAAPQDDGTQGVFSININGTGGTLVAADAYEAEILNSNLYYTLYDSDLGLSQIWKSNTDGSSPKKLSDGAADDRLDLTVD